jgi:uncharacterized protein YlxW (UPF0749 family)
MSDADQPVNDAGQPGPVAPETPSDLEATVPVSASTPVPAEPAAEPEVVPPPPPASQVSPGAEPSPASEVAPASESAAEAKPEEKKAPVVEREDGEVPVPPKPRRRVSAGGAVIGVLLGLLGFALVVQLRSNATEPYSASARPDQLVTILSDLDSRKDRLSQEITTLQATEQQLRQGSEGRAAALTEATKRAEELGILAGTLAAEGPGMTVRMVPGNQALKAWMILDTVEELRGAGAEAMEIAGVGGAPVRIVASTYFTDAGSGLLVDGATLQAPYTITVIGDPQTMQPALNIAGGVVDTVHNANGTVIVEPGTVRVTATHTTNPPRYAQPVN